MSQQRTEPTAYACALTRNHTHDLLLCETLPNQVNHTILNHFEYQRSWRDFQLHKEQNPKMDFQNIIFKNPDY